MTKRILVPVDLEHVDRQEKALAVAASIAKAEGAEIRYFAMTGTAPTGAAANPSAFADALARFAKGQAVLRGVATSFKAATAHDTSVELPRAILAAGEEFDADLIIMASHIPGLKEHLFSTNAGYIANHAPVSVYVVR